MLQKKSNEIGTEFQNVLNTKSNCFACYI